MKPGMEALAESFDDEYGFPHLCRCDFDIMVGNLIEVPECQLELVESALHYIEDRNKKVYDLENRVRALEQQIKDLGFSPK